MHAHIYNQTYTNEQAIKHKDKHPMKNKTTKARNDSVMDQQLVNLSPVESPSETTCGTNHREKINEVAIEHFYPTGR